MNYLVDTNVLSELAKPLPADGVLAWFHSNQSQLYVSSVTIGEIRKGLELMPAGKRKESLKVWFKAICDTMEGRILSFNTATARVWGQMVGSLEKKRHPPPHHRQPTRRHRSTQRINDGDEKRG